MRPERFTTLNPKVQSFTDTFGNYGSMTVSEFAACLAGADPVGEFILRRKYIDKKERGRTYLKIYKNIVYAVYESDKIPPKPNMIEPLLEEAIKDYIGDNLCEKCDGRQQITIGTQIHKCPSKRCNDGKVRRKDWQRAKSLGLTAKDFSRHYKQTFKVIEDYLTKHFPEAESEAYNHVQRRAKWHDVTEL